MLNNFCIGKAERRCLEQSKKRATFEQKETNYK